MAERLSAAEDRNLALEKELAHANELLLTTQPDGVVPSFFGSNAKLGAGGEGGSSTASVDPIAGLSETAAVASRALKEGLSLTQVWTELADTRENLQRQKAENRRINSYLQKILDVCHMPCC